MRNTADFPDATSQARIIQELRRQKQLRFSLGVNASYLVLIPCLFWLSAAWNLLFWELNFPQSLWIGISFGSGRHSFLVVWG